MDTLPSEALTETPENPPKAETAAQKPVEIGGSDKPEPTRYGDWEINGKCVDF